MGLENNSKLFDVVKNDSFSVSLNMNIFERLGVQKLKLNESYLHAMFVDFFFMLKCCMQKKSNCRQGSAHADRPHILTSI